jgi:putative membrane protein
VPFRRIHNVTLHRNVLHRFFGVAEVRLESAGGVKPEAEMRVLRLADAQALEALVRREGLLHRWLQRRSLDVDTAVAEQQNQPRALRELAPIATPAECDALIEHLLPNGQWSRLPWRSLPLRHWWRMLLPSVPWVLLASAALGWRFGGWGALALLWLPWSAFAAYRRMRRAGYALGPELVAVRGGWINRHWRFAELDKLQALQLTRSPLDRRCGTATLWLDTAGAGAMAPPLRIRFLPQSEAHALYVRLGREIAHRRLRW